MSQQDYRKTGIHPGPARLIRTANVRWREGGAHRYRALHWEAGLLGQVLYLEAEAAGLRATGIGCFFDERVHDLLGLDPQRFAMLYGLSVGGPVDDARLVTLEGYAHLATPP